MPFDLTESALLESDDAAGVDGALAIAPGKVTLTGRLRRRGRGSQAVTDMADTASAAGAAVQREAGAGSLELDPFAVHLMASHGVTGGGGALRTATRSRPASATTT